MLSMLLKSHIFLPAYERAKTFGNDDERQRCINEAFDRIARKYKDNIPKKYKTSLDQNLHRVKGLQYMVDGLFTTPGYKASNVKLVDGVSDHVAIVADIEKVRKPYTNFGFVLRNILPKKFSLNRKSKVFE